MAARRIRRDAARRGELEALPVRERSGMRRMGLPYHGARYYAAWLGRWTSSDPIGMKDESNLYRYVHNIPGTCGFARGR